MIALAVAGRCFSEVGDSGRVYRYSSLTLTAILVNELIVLALHRGVEALVADLGDSLANSALLVATKMGCGLVTLLALLHRYLVVLYVVLGALS